MMQRSQDYLINAPGQDENQDTQRSYRLAGGPSVSFTGGQTRSTGTFQKAQQATPDRARERFRTREKQIRSGRPVDFNLFGDAGQTRKRIEEDITSQGIQREKELERSAPKLDEFLPDYDRALAGDQQAILRTGERLNTDFEQREIAPIRSFESQNELDFLKAPSQEAFHTQLARQRGGSFGVNALDAARLAASGLGSSAFTQASKDIGQAFNLERKTEDELRLAEEERARKYDDLVKYLRGRLVNDESAITRESARQIEDYRNRDVTADLKALLEQAKLQAPELSPYLGMDFRELEPFIDRDLTFAEALTPEQSSRYNIIAELLGKSPVQTISRGQEYNKDAIIAALLAEARQEQEAAKIQDARIKENIRKAQKREPIRVGNQEFKDVTPIPEHKKRQYEPPKQEKKKPGGLVGKIVSGSEKLARGEWPF